MERTAAAREIPWARARASLRFEQWLHFVPLPLAALAPSSPVGPIELAALLRGAPLAASLLGYAYALNAIADRGTDGSRAKNPLRGLEGVPVRVLVVIGGAALASLALALASGPIACGCAVVSFVASTLYSAGPRWKRIPLVGTLVNAAIFAPLLGVGVAGGTLPAAMLTLVLAFSGLLLQNQLLHERADADEDRRAGVVSTGVILGPRGTPWVALGIGVSGAIAAGAIAPSVSVAIVARIALVLGGLVPMLPWPAARLRLAHRVVSVGAGAAVFAAQWVTS